MTTKKLVLEVIDCAFDRQSWHGAHLMSAIRGVRAKQAAKPVHGRKSIWQQMLHAAYWKHRILNKLIGRTPFERRGSNWPKLPDQINEKTWRADIEFLRSGHTRLRDAVAKLNPKKLDAKMIWRLHGIAAHDLYHAGQIKLLRRLIDRPR